MDGSAQAAAAHSVASAPPAHPGSEAELLFEAQRRAFAAEGPPGATRRHSLLERLEKALLSYRAEIAQAISEDFGHRSSDETELLELVPSIKAIRHAKSHLVRWMRPERRRVALTMQPAKAWVEYQPLGMIGIISPWNYPLFLAASPLADALAAGNRAMIKPSELTPRFSELLKGILTEAFDPADVAVITGGPDVAEAFSKLPFDHLLFTGSTSIGRKVMQAAAANLTPVTLELGGKSPVVVCPDYPTEKAARAIAFGKFVNAGQTCIAPDYVLAPAARAMELADAILAEAKRLYPRIADNPDYTSIITDRHYQRLTNAIEEAREGGATVLSIAEETASNSRKIPPTIVIDPPANSLLMREEIFGPVLPIVSSDSLDDALRIINDKDRPLALYVLTNSETNRRKILERTISGGVTLNGTLMHVAQNDLPFGGVGPSGMGAYHGFDGFKRFSHARAIHKVGFMNGFERLAPPYGRLQKMAVSFLLGR
ncbi:MAG: coniferyl aldehyde dehydrogenase [Methylobacteriaceae bacterium]|nr:coniferyl aldehyde dehydrogenase [Methylobacteriaceae bacterium]